MLELDQGTQGVLSAVLGARPAQERISRPRQTLLALVVERRSIGLGDIAPSAKLTVDHDWSLAVGCRPAQCGGGMSKQADGPDGVALLYDGVGPRDSGPPVGDAV